MTRGIVSQIGGWYHCLMRKFVDLTGMRFERWTVLGLSRKNPTGMLYYKCRCDCGTEKDVLAAQLRGGTKSCGCLQRLGIIEPKSKRHGMWRHPAYKAWGSMRARCRNPADKGYADYGGRGISVCERWNDFALFWEDMGPRWAPGLSVDRVDVNGDYCPENCRWATNAMQARNTRRNRYIDTPWGTMVVADAAKKAGLHHGVVYNRLNAGWAVDDLLSPVMTRWERRALRFPGSV
jgi:hypothetical protein